MSDLIIDPPNLLYMMEHIRKMIIFRVNGAACYLLSSRGGQP